MEITIHQLEQLLNEQKAKCMEHFDKTYWQSDFLKSIRNYDTNDAIANKVHEVRDTIMDSPFPNDFYVLERYKIN